MLTKEQKELFQKDKYELVDMIIRLKRGVEIEETEPSVNLAPPQDAIKRSLNKLKKELGYGQERNKEENYQAYREEDG